MENKPVKQSSGGGSAIRNIVIGVITPVLAATIIYFLGFNNGDDKAAYKIKKEATEKAWAAYIQNRGIFSAVMKELGKSGDIEVTRKNINHEIDIMVSNLEDIKKEPSADQRVYSSVDIVIQQMKDMKPVMNKFLDDINTYASTNPSEEEGKAFILNLGEDLKQQMVQLRQRDSLRLAVFYEGLNKDYKTTLPTGAEIKSGN